MSPQFVQARVVADLFAQSRFRNVMPAVFNWAAPSANTVPPHCAQTIFFPPAEYSDGPN